MNAGITSATRLVALLGDPVAHSLSPIFQNAAFDAAGLDAVYLALRSSSADLPALLTGVALAGGAGNVTVPHKEAAAAIVQAPSDAVCATGACNTFWFEDGEIQGDNTDVPGFLRAIDPLLGGSPAGARVLLIGAGGAARGAVHGLIESGADEVVIVNRSPERSEEIRSRFADRSSAVRISSLASISGEFFDLAVNATSLGLAPGDPLPLPLEKGPTFGAAFDMVYSPDRTPWVSALRDRGVPAEDGLEMLLQQGAVAFERWWGFPPSMVAMRAVLPIR